MNKYLFLFLIFCSSVFGLRVDPNSSSFSQREKKRVEVYDFTGDYPNLSDIDIDARKKINVELLLSGNYPLLKKIHFEGGFGAIKGALTGQFPHLDSIIITCTDAFLDLDLCANWERPCEINITCTGDVTLKLPKDVGLFVTIKTATPFEKIRNNHPTLYKRKGVLLQKIFLTPSTDTTPRPLTINLTSDRGIITLN